MKITNRLKFLHIAVCLGFLAGIFGSLELWFPVNRYFPRVPILFALPESSVVIFERFFAVCLIASFVSIVFFGRRKIFYAVAIASLALLIFFDQTRLQPWVYQYFLLLVVIALNDESGSDQTPGLAQIIVAGLYFWSGVQKMNFTFSHETLPILLAPLEDFFTVELPFVLFGIGIALTESLIGIGLFFRRTRNLSVVLAVAMHAVILILLVLKNYNHIVWIWNAALIAMVVILFWKNDVSIRRIFTVSHSENWKTISAKVAVAAAVFLPVMSFAGWWDSYLSGALYSGNTAVGVVRINDALYEKLPPKTQKSVFQTKSGEKILPFVEWAIAEINVPAYPAQRVFKQTAREVCRLTNDKNGIELIIKQRPAILDGSYKLTRISCEELEKY